jgi:hypothetical protein
LGQTRRGVVRIGAHFQSVSPSESFGRLPKKDSRELVMDVVCLGANLEHFRVRHMREVACKVEKSISPT